jgi:hypothetical protein
VSFEIDYVGAAVHLVVTDDSWSAEADLFATGMSGDRLTASACLSASGPSSGIAAITKEYMGPPLPQNLEARRRILDTYRVQRHDVEDAMNQMLGRDPDMHRPPRLGWCPLIELLVARGQVVSEEALIALPFVFEFSTEATIYIALE